MSAIRVLVADDHQLFRQGIRHIFETIGGCIVVGEAENGTEAVALAKKLTPDIVLMDINMPQLDGVQATARISAEAPSVRVVILTMYHDDGHALNAIKAGARGYLCKDMDGQALVDAIKAVYLGEGIMTPETVGNLLSEYQRIIHRSEKENIAKNLTNGEMGVLKQVARGRNNRQIAERLGISERSVVHRLSEIFSKLEVSNRTQAALVALRQGWASLNADR